jgi:hypothetical protein
MESQCVELRAAAECEWKIRRCGRHAQGIDPFRQRYEYSDQAANVTVDGIAPVNMKAYSCVVHVRYLFYVEPS